MKHLASFRVEELDDTETAFVSWDLDECDPRVEDIAYYDIDFRTRRVFAEYPRVEALEYVDACDVRACRGCEAPPPYCVCCTACGAPPHIACACDALLYRENDNDRAAERALAAGF